MRHRWNSARHAQCDAGWPPCQRRSSLENLCKTKGKGNKKEGRREAQDDMAQPQTTHNHTNTLQHDSTKHARDRWSSDRKANSEGEEEDTNAKEEGRNNSKVQLLENASPVCGFVHLVHKKLARKHNANQKQQHSQLAVHAWAQRWLVHILFIIMCESTRVCECEWRPMSRERPRKREKEEEVGRERGEGGSEGEVKRGQERERQTHTPSSPSSHLPHLPHPPHLPLSSSSSHLFH